MYDGKNKIAVRSKESIARACAELVDAGGLEDISVNAIAKKARVSRQTFYSLFGTKRSAVSHAVRTYHPLKVPAGSPSAAYESVSSTYAAYLTENAALVRNLLNCGYDNVLIEVFEDALGSCEGLASAPYEHRTPQIVAFLAGGLAACAREFLCGRKQASQGAMERAAFFLMTQGEL